MNYPVNINELEHQVEQIRSNTVSVKSRAIYSMSTIKFLILIFTNKVHLITNDFKSLLVLNESTGEPTVASIKNALSSRPPIDPIYFESLTANDFFTWIVSLKKKMVVSWD
jgi:hypothetical protein